MYQVSHRNKPHTSLAGPNSKKLINPTIAQLWQATNLKALSSGHQWEYKYMSVCIFISSQYCFFPLGNSINPGSLDKHFNTVENHFNTVYQAGIF